MSRQVTLTSGPILPQLLRLCGPLLAANVLQQLYNIINSLVVTYYLGENAFAALGVAESIMNLFIYVITGACMGASVLVAQFYGKGDYPMLRRQLFVSAVLIGGCTLTAVVLGQIFLPQILTLIQTPAELMADAVAYLRVILVGMVFTFTYNYLASSLRAVGDTKIALYFLLLSLGYNLVCAWVLVAVLKLGITGTAIATATAQLLSSGLCVAYIRKNRPYLTVGREDMHMDRGLAGKTVSFAAVAALQQSSLYLGKLMIQSAVNNIGTAAISAFTAATRVENFVQAFGLGGCEAISIFVAQNKGADQDKRARSGFLQGMGLSIAIGLVFSAGMGIFAGPLAQLFLGGGEGYVPCVSYLQLISWFFILSFFGNSFVGWFRGTGRMNVTFWGTTMQISIRVVGTWVLAGRMGLDSVALATGIGWSAIVVYQFILYTLERKGIWPK